jgi:hypothetical protein
MGCFSTFKGLLLAAGLLIGCASLRAQEPQAGIPNHPDDGPVQSSDCKDHVYIFAIDGFNPCNLGKFNRFCNHLREEGFENTHFYYLHNCWGVCREIRCIHEQDPDAHIVLIGFSAGCCCVRRMTESLAHDGIQVDLLVYLAGDFVQNTPSWHPDNVGRVLNVRARGYIPIGAGLIFNGADLYGARNFRLDIAHILTPSNPNTMALVMEELGALSNVAVAPAPTPAVPTGNQPSRPAASNSNPTPAPVVPMMWTARSRPAASTYNPTAIQYPGKPVD